MYNLIGILTEYLIDTYGNLKAYGKLADIWGRLAIIFPNDPNVKANLEKYRNLAKQDRTDIDSVPVPTDSMK